MMIELNDTLSDVANVTGTIGNAIILVGMAYGFFRLGRKPFFLAYLLATPIILCMSVVNTLSCFGSAAALAVFPASAWKILIPATNALYPVAVILNVTGMCLLLAFMKRNRDIRTST